jgi:xanthine dehydrogenase molybdopterin-binding subunit B
MPTLAGDVQMVLADGKVLFQNQEVAFVVATDRYAADDGINAVEVEYEELAGPRSIRSRRWTPMRRCCARTSRTRRTAHMGRASITTTSSNGRSATRI